MEDVVPIIDLAEQLPGKGKILGEGFQSVNRGWNNVKWAMAVDQIGALDNGLQRNRADEPFPLPNLKSHPQVWTSWADTSTGTMSKGTCLGRSRISNTEAKQAHQHAMQGQNA